MFSWAVSPHPPLKERGRISRRCTFPNRKLGIFGQKKGARGEKRDGPFRQTLSLSPLPPNFRHILLSRKSAWAAKKRGLPKMRQKPPICIHTANFSKYAITLVLSSWRKSKLNALRLDAGLLVCHTMHPEKPVSSN